MKNTVKQTKIKGELVLGGFKFTAQSSADKLSRLFTPYKGWNYTDAEYENHSKALISDNIAIYYSGDEDTECNCTIECSYLGSRYNRKHEYEYVYTGFSRGESAALLREIYNYPDIYKVNDFLLVYKDLGNIIPMHRLIDDTFNNLFETNFHYNKTTKCNLYNYENLVYHSDYENKILLLFTTSVNPITYDVDYVNAGLRFSDSRAEQVINSLDKVGEEFALTIGSNIRYVTKTDDDISQCKTTDYWNEFIADAKKIKM